MSRTHPHPRPGFLLLTLTLLALALPSEAVDPWTPAALQGRTANDGLTFPDTLAPTAFVATDQGVYWTAMQADGSVTAELRSTGLPAGSVSQLAFAPSGNPDVVYAATSQGVYRTTDRGLHWSAFNGGFPAEKYCPSIVRSGGYLFAAIPMHGVYRSDGSSDWAVTGALPTGPFGDSFPYRLGAATDSAGNPIVLAGTSGAGMALTYDGGTSWESSGVTEEMATWVNTMAIDPYAPGTWYVGNGDARMGNPKWFYKTHSFGETWDPDLVEMIDDFITMISTIIAYSSRSAGGATFSPVLVGTHSGTVLESVDGGTTWQDITGNLPVGVEITFMGSMGNYLLAGVAGQGLFKLPQATCDPTCTAMVPASAMAGASIPFSATAQVGGCSGTPSYDWDFGDGTLHGSDLGAAHSYSTPGTYAWTFTVSAGGKSCAKAGTILVSQAVGTIQGSVVVGTAATAYPLSGLGFSAMAQLTDSFGNTQVDALDPNGAFEFGGLAPGAYQVRVELEYRDHIPYDAQSGAMGCPHPSGDGITKTVTSLPVLVQVAAGFNAVEVRFPPPLVLVHGVPGCYQKWYSDDPATPGYAALWDVAAREAGVISFTPNYAWSGACTSWNRMASQLGDQMLEDLTGLHEAARGPSLPPVYLAAYDFGGLVARALCSGPYADHPATAAIQGIFLLASPNSGADSLFGGGANVLTSPNFVVRRFNEIYPNFGIKNSAVYAVGGDSGWWGQSDGDGRVSLYSAFNIARTSCSEITSHLTACRPYTSISFPSGSGHIFPYTHADVGSPPSTQAILEGTILPIVADGQILGSPESPAGSTIWGTGARTTGSAQGTVQSRSDTAVSDYPFVCSATDGMGVIAYASAGSATFEVIPPSGRTQRRGEVEAGQESGFTYTQLNPEPGGWNLRITPGPEGVTFQAVMLENSLFGISAYVDKTAYLPGEVAILRVDEDASLAPEAQFTEIVASVYDAGGALFKEVHLLDDGENHDGDAGDGQWGATVAVPAPPGSYPVLFEARGQYGGKDFVRTSSERLSVVPESHLFTGVFSDTPVDIDGDAKYDFIRFTAQLDLPAGCGVVVAGDLTDADGEFIGHATAFVDAPSQGLVDARLWFRLERLFCTQLLRALQVENLSVLDGLALSPVDAWGTPVSTANYDSSSFDCKPGTVTPSLGTVRPDQATQGQALDVVVSGRGFRSGATLDFGDGIVLRRMVYLGPTAIAASVTVLENAAPGPRAVKVTNPGNASDTGQGAFEVVAPSSPTVALQTPSSGQTVHGTVLASAAASDSLRVSEVALLVDGTPVATDAAFPFQFTWDSRSVPNGPHSLAARAMNAAGLTRTSAAATVTVDNPTTPGDCDGSGTVSIGEVQKAINMFLGVIAPACGVDCSGDGTVSIGEVQKVINGFLGVQTSC